MKTLHQVEICLLVFGQIAGFLLLIWSFTNFQMSAVKAFDPFPAAVRHIGWIFTFSRLAAAAAAEKTGQC